MAPPPSSPLHVRLEDISKSFGVVDALIDVSVDLVGGQIHALCGHNGAGKSTLVKVLAGLVQPDKGQITRDGAEVTIATAREAQANGIALVEQERGLVPALTVAENLVLGDIAAGFLVNQRAMRARARDLLARVGCEDIHPDTRLQLLSAGERKLTEIARAVGRDCQVLILDEPTAALSYSESRRVFEVVRALAERGGAIVFVSHRLDEVFELCDQITVMRDGRKVTSAPAAELTRASLVELMVGDAAEKVEEPDEVERPPRAVAERLSPTLRIRSLMVPPRVADLDLEVAGGTIVGLAGQIGSGASDVLRALGGLSPRARGEVEVDGKRVNIRSPLTAARSGLRYVTYDRKGEGLFLEHSIGTNITATRLPQLSRLGVITRRARRQLASHLVELTGVRPPELKTAVQALSGGNQQKVLVGRCLEGATGEVFLLDDPTQGVDVVGREEIHNLIRGACEAGNTVLLVSTELDELLELADVVVTVYDGRIVSVMRRDEATATRILAEITHTSQAAIATAEA